jgi:hypothetical protein
MLKKSVCMGVIVMVMLAGVVFAGETIISDDFEGYKDSAQLQEVYTVTGSNEITGELSTTVNHTSGGSKSVVLNSSGFYQRTRNIRKFDETLTNIEISVWVKPNGPKINERGVLRVRWEEAPPGARDLLIAVWNSRNNFMFRDTLAGIGWTESDIPKTSGWHKFTVRITEQGATILIDDVEVYTTKDFTGATYVDFADEWGKPFEAMEPVYFDDLSVVNL